MLPGKYIYLPFLVGAHCVFNEVQTKSLTKVYVNISIHKATTVFFDEVFCVLSVAPLSPFLLTFISSGLRC
jgi:hypothetical protein